LVGGRQGVERDPASHDVCGDRLLQAGTIGRVSAGLLKPVPRDPRWQLPRSDAGIQLVGLHP
jgi:hypothetical protein